MSVNELHPLYSEFLPRWEQCKDTHAGSRAVKLRGTLYLPATGGMVADGMSNALAPGYLAYDAYRRRAVVPDFMSEAVRALVGVMWHKSPVINLPAVMEPLRENGTLQGESLAMLLRKINEQQLIYGRVGVLADMPVAPSRTSDGVQASGRTMTRGDLPYLAFYTAENIINWDAGRRDGIEVENLNLVVLDESENERQSDFSWEWMEKYRVLVLGEVDVNEPRGDGVYRVGVFRDNNANFDENALVEPSYRGNKLKEIPFVFINSCDIVPTPDSPPLMGLSDLQLTVYRGEADYRQNLFAQSQDTLVTVGLTDDGVPLRIGAGGHINIPTGGDAKFIGVSADGLGEQRSALENDYLRAAQMGSQLLSVSGKAAESGEALGIRVAARTATLNQIALTGAYGLERLLRMVAVWTGANPEEVEVIPNTDFVKDVFNPDDLLKFVSAKNAGAPISNETIHAWMRKKEVTNIDFDEEIEKISEEELLGVGSTASQDLPQGEE